MADQTHSAQRWHTATRRLCAGAYLDREYRDRLLRDIYNVRDRRVAPSYGYDLTQVLRHAWRAWWLETTCDLLAAALFAAFLVIVPLAALLLVGLLGAWRMLRLLVKVLKEAVRQVFSDDYSVFDHMPILKRKAKVGGRGLFGAVLVILGALLAMHQGPGGWPYRGNLTQAALIILVYLGLFAGTGVARQRQLDHLTELGVLDRHARSRRLRTVQRQQEAPVTVYSGYEPFVGSGLKVRPWSFAQRLVRRHPLEHHLGDPEQEFTEPPFSSAELVEHVKRSIQELAETATGETALPGLTVRDHVFVEGIRIRDAPEVLLEPLPAEVLERSIAEPNGVARYHIACQVVSWDGDLVTTVFVNVSLQGRILYVEFTTYALTPTPDDFAVVDRVGGTGPAAVFWSAARRLAEVPELLSTPTRLAAAPRRLAKSFMARWDPIPEVSKSRDVGALISARQLADELIKERDRERSGDRWLRGAVTGDRGADWLDIDDANYFQFLDVAKHSKIIERRLLAAIEEFLQAKGVDTAEFVQRATAILNNGIINTGSGPVNVNGSAFGDNPTVNGAPDPD